jgi:hypothetical protein
MVVVALMCDTSAWLSDISVSLRAALPISK